MHIDEYLFIEDKCTLNQYFLKLLFWFSFLLELNYRSISTNFQLKNNYFSNAKIKVFKLLNFNNCFIVNTSFNTSVF